MFRRDAVTGLPKLSRRDRAAFRRARRALEAELAAYTSDTDRNDLAVMVDASISSAAWDVEKILSSQAHVRLYQHH